MVLQRQPDRLGAVPGVDIAPEIPIPQPRTRRNREGLRSRPAASRWRTAGRSCSAPGSSGRIGRPSALRGACPANRSDWPAGIFLVHRHVRRRGVERQTEHRLAGGPHDVGDCRIRAAEKTLYVLGHVVVEGGGVRRQARAPESRPGAPRRQRPVAIVDGGQRRNGLPVIGQVDPHEVTALRCADGHAIEGDDIPPCSSKWATPPGQAFRCPLLPRPVPSLDSSSGADMTVFPDRPHTARRSRSRPHTSSGHAGRPEPVFTPRYSPDGPVFL